jgi:hypothetical protein
MSLLYGYFLVAIVLDHAHLACPIGLAWSNRTFRQRMLERWDQYLLLPALCILIPLGIGEGSATTRDPAFQFLVLVNMWWNAWHFGSQHFGVASLLGWRSGPRWLRKIAIILPTMLVMIAPTYLFPTMTIIVLGESISFLHWSTDLGLTVWSCRKCSTTRILLIGAAVLMACGLMGFVWKTTTTDPRICGLLPACTAVWSIPTLLSLRYGLGFYHFLMSRWVWSSEGRGLLHVGLLPVRG